MRNLSFHRSGESHLNLISGIYNFCERREYAFNILPEYSIITQYIDCLMVPKILWSG